MRRLALIVSLLIGLAGLTGACGNATQPPGTLRLVIGGLPEGVNADVTVTGPNEFSRQPGNEPVLNDLAPGTYQVTARIVSNGTRTFRPDPSVQSVVVTSAETASVRIAYADASLTTGRLDITIDGLPVGSAAPVTVGGPDGFLRGVRASESIDGLEPGTYIVTALELESEGDIFTPDRASRSVAVLAGDTTSVRVVYQQPGPASGQMEVIIAGLPVGVLAPVTVSDEVGFEQTVAATATLTGLTPGEYRISAAEVGAGPYTFAPPQTFQRVTVEANRLARVTVQYAATTSAVTLIVEGLPSGAAAAVALELADGSAPNPDVITESTTLTDLSPGSYRVSAAAIDFDGFRFEPGAPSVTIEATAGETTVVTVAYQPVDGKILVTEEGLPGNDPVVIAKLFGPGLESETRLTTDTFLQGLEPGSYSLGERLTSIVFDDVSYVLEGVPAILEVLPGQVTVVAARFVAQQGDLAIEIRGLPVGFDSDVVVTGGGGFNVEVKGSTTLFALEPGTYTVSASDVPDEGRDYQPSPASQTVTVLKARTVTATVRYAKPPVVCCSP